jgi:glycosyltransferase involved in cell wall biosynthesis
MPMVSVIIATYNRARYLPATVASVLGQTFHDFELIVVDDGSTDDTAVVLKPFQGRLRYVYQENAERGAARNRGLRLASGKYVAFLDSDDLWAPNKLEAEVETLRRRPGLGLVYSDACYIDSEGRPCGQVRRRLREGDVIEHIGCDNFIPFGAHLADRERFLAAGAFSEDRLLSGSEDWEAWARLAAEVPFGHVANTGLFYRVHDSGSVAQPQNLERSMLRAWGMIFQNPKLRLRIAHLEPHSRATVHLVLASLYAAAGSPPDAIRHLGQARAHDPRIVFGRRYLGMGLRLMLGQRLLSGLRVVKHRLLQGRAPLLRKGGDHRP